MPLPPELKVAIDRELAGVNRSQLAKASGHITEAYKQGRFHGSLSSPDARAAYLATRLPATFAANMQVFREVARVVPDLNPLTLLDLGAGPGTAMWAAKQVWPSLLKYRLIENNGEFLRLGERLANNAEEIHWLENDISAMSQFPASDLVVLSYAIGELKNPASVIEKAWDAAQKALVIIEPGTPRNFAVVVELRHQLISWGAQPIAPCPHSLECPMAHVGDWCHFAVRLERTAEHRRLKGGALGYEDEKFSYLAFSKSPVPQTDARIVRHPIIHSGHIQLTLCTAEGLQSPTVRRSQKPAFRAARKASWGDAWPNETQLE